MLFLIGLGLGDVKDITVKGLEMIQSSNKVYLECYTSILAFGPQKESLEKFYGKEVQLADRETIEQNADQILNEAKSEHVSLLIVGDPFGATTHSDLFLRAKQENIPVKVVHNASILNAIGCTGLQLYNFGETVSICFWEDNWQPDSYFDKIIANLDRGLHTLCLLDIKVREMSLEAMMKKKKEYLPPRYMSASDAAKQLLAISGCKNLSDAKLTKNTIVVGVARIGWENQKIMCCSLEEMTQIDLGPPLHSLIITGNLHHIEHDMLALWKRL